MFACLPFVSFAVVLFTLRHLASFDVKDDPFYILFYVLLGFTWFYAGLKLMEKYFDLSWSYDALNLNNDAALFAIAGGILGLTVIYAGANIGDGPGWWCVVTAGGLGALAWGVLAKGVNRFTSVFERVTIERDVSCGIRLGSYLLASGIILGRASAGDWTSLEITFFEFMDGWPLLPFTALAIGIERYYIRQAETRRGYENDLATSICWGMIYVFVAVAIVMLLPPLRENPLYSDMPVTFRR